ncbi:phospholipase D-like domain-containing protein [Rhizobium sp. TRM95111]|uniref:phospholipase D-like domain-containing protein n=1 Tax=Rhizobium alarense TaxID=2846851 RepID=UPI001F19CFA1|nr:phospholipase D-like domain-containing protein [Rhizobium alarense]MCF3641143.1 phospholipase D-like domain-containing protein [Rhizobium alarense]
MFQTLSDYWPHVLVVLSILVGAPAAIHATMTKEEVRAALGWVGVILLSPIAGALIYAVAGVNRIRRKSLNLQREGLATLRWARLATYECRDDDVRKTFGGALTAMKRVGDAVSRCALTSANRIHMLETGDAAYGAMLEAIERAEGSVLLETYIFDRDSVGERFVDALSRAVARGVQVRVLIDAVGARYSVPSVVGALREAGVPVRIFNGNIIMGLRLPYANLRTHRKLLLVDGRIAFTGGMNIRSAFVADGATPPARDTHFSVTGPIVGDLFHTAYEDWRFSGGEKLSGAAWQVAAPAEPPGSPLLARVVPSGPDRSLEANHRMLMGAFSLARHRIRIMSPYFLPDRELISALATAARRGVAIDIVVPRANNLKLVDLAMTAQFDQLLKFGCRIWRANGPFDHSKLTVIDGVWSLVGSSNLDPRSLRLNFEIDIEVIDTIFAETIEARIRRSLDGARPVLLDELRARPFARRLVERITWLGSPYL